MHSLNADEQGGLDLSNRALRDRDLEALLRAAGPESLSRLDLFGNRLGRRACALLAATSWLRGLRELELGSNALGQDRSIAALLEAPFLAELQLLGLAYTGLTEAALGRLLGSPRLTALRSLDLRGAPVGPAQIRALATNTALGALERLDISDNGLGPDAVGDEEVELLIGAAALPSLRLLVLLPPRIWGSAGEVDVAAWRTGGGEPSEGGD